MKKVTSRLVSKEVRLSLHDSIYVWGGKWKTLILIYLAMNEKGRNYFLQIKRDTQGISAKMLTKELRDLEMNNLVKRTVHRTKPITVEYAITEYGKTLVPVVKAFIKWGINHRKVIKSR
jgi:DNA-binding HxlR family transcriptional regulator